MIKKILEQQILKLRSYSRLKRCVLIFSCDTDQIFSDHCEQKKSNSHVLWSISRFASAARATKLEFVSHFSARRISLKSSFSVSTSQPSKNKQLENSYNNNGSQGRGDGDLLFLKCVRYTIYDPAGFHFHCWTVGQVTLKNQSCTLRRGMLA